MSFPSHRRTGAVGAALARIHPVDKGLLLYMLVLLLQSACSLFCPAASDGIPGDIDVIVRTSAAAIFGYFLSANFIRHTGGGGQAPAVSQPRILETGTDSPAQAKGPVAQIGFSAGETGTQPEAPAADAASQTSEDSGTSHLQVVAATAIGLFCLAVLLVLRCLILRGVIPADSPIPVSTVTQFRDLISGCIGFLIGCPTHSPNSIS